MFSIFPLPKLNMVAAFLALFLAIHSFQNDKLSKTSRKFFSLTFTLSLVSICVEYFYPLIPSNVSKHIIEIFYLVVMCADQLIPLLLFKACDIKITVTFKAVALLAIIHTIGEIVMYPFDLVFYIDEDNVFHYGPAGWFYTLFGVVAILLIARIYLRLGKRFNHQKIQYLIFSLILLILGGVGDQIDAIYGASYLMKICGLMLLYVYYSDLCTLKLIESLKDSKKQLVYTLARAIDAKDKYTNGHSLRVSQYSGILARELGYSEEAVSNIEEQAMLHDVGKIGVPDSVLNKASRLDDVEFEMIKAHTRMGGDIISHATQLADAFAACRYHHERYDGKGYPDGLKGEEIPAVARIVAIADSYDAMNSDRIYRKSLNKDIIRNELLKGSGTQFDPEYLKVFIKLFDEDRLKTDMGEYDISEGELTEFEEEIKDLFYAFELKKDYLDGYDAEYAKFDLLRKHLEDLKANGEENFALVHIDIKPKKDQSVSKELADSAMDTIEAVAGAATSATPICQRVSVYQLAIVLTGEDTVNIKDTMQNILLYFYKIFDTAPFDITYGLYEKN